MKQKAMLNSIKKATIEMILLKLLSEEDMYGYQLAQECKKRSNGSYAILEGSMYPILYRLEEANYISCYEKKVGKRMTRVYYHMENTGKEYLTKTIEAYYDALHLVETLLTSSNTKQGGQKT
jgi:PadR family transcriptional regulator PadR